MENQSELFIKQVAVGLDTATRLIESLASETKENSINIATLESEIDNILDEVKLLSKILRDGNGNEPVLSRLVTLELISKNLSSLTKEIDDKVDAIKLNLVSLEQNKQAIEKKEEKQQEVEIEDNRQKKSNRLQLIIAVVTTIVSLIIAIISAL